MSRSISRSPAWRHSVATVLVVALFAFLSVAATHSVHHDTSPTCATCRVVRHTPAVLAAAPVPSITWQVIPLFCPPAESHAAGVVPPCRSRGPPR